MIRVILADDHALMHQGVSGILEKVDDIELVAAVTSGESAIKVVRKLRPDVVLMDVNMDGIGGFTAMRKLLDKDPELKIIGVSGYEDTTYPELFMQSGAKGYLSKKVPLSVFPDAIRKVYQGGEHVDTLLATQMQGSASEVSQEDPFLALSERERQVCRCKAEGLDEERIADRLGVVLKTVRAYRVRAYEKLHVSNDIELLRLALRFRFISG